MRFTDFILAHATRYPGLYNLLYCLGAGRRSELDRAAEDWHQAEPKRRYRVRSPDPIHEKLFESRCCK